MTPLYFGTLFSSSHPRIVQVACTGLLVADTGVRRGPRRRLLLVDYPAAQKLQQRPPSAFPSFPCCQWTEHFVGPTSATPKRALSAVSPFLLTLWALVGGQTAEKAKKVHRTSRHWQALAHPYPGRAPPGRAPPLWALSKWITRGGGGRRCEEEVEREEEGGWWRG